MKRLKIISIVLLALVPTVFPIAAQGRSRSHAHNLRAGKITGVVLDANDARIAGAIVLIEKAKFSRLIQSDDQGGFKVDVPAGVYRITVEMDGFKRFVLSHVSVRAGARASISIRMEVKPPGRPLKIE